MTRYTVRWQEMFKDELEAVIAKRPLCLFSYGLAEPHGPQSALGVDGLRSYALVERFAHEYGGVVAPPFWWHVSETPHELEWLSHQNAPQPFLTDIPPELLYHQVVYHLRAAEAAGFRAAILVSGHGGGFMPDIAMVAHVYSAKRPLRVRALLDMDLVSEPLFPKDHDHAGPNEISLLWALCPDLVDMSRFPEDRITERLYATSESARYASRRAGEKMVEQQVNALTAIADDLLTDARDMPPSERLSFEQTEEIWQLVKGDQTQWAATHALEDFDQYRRKREKLYPALQRRER